MYDLGYYSAHKGTDTLCEYGFTMSPPITYICLCAGWLMGNVRSRYLRYEVAGDQFRGQEMSALNPMTSDFSFYCYYLETTENQVKICKCIYEKFLRKAIIF